MLEASGRQVSLGTSALEPEAPLGIAPDGPRECAGFGQRVDGFPDFVATGCARVGLHRSQALVLLIPGVGTSGCRPPRLPERPQASNRRVLAAGGFGDRRQD